MTAAKSILDIEVNDADFKQFIFLFNQYKANLASLPGEWNKQEEAISEVASSAGELSGKAGKLPGATAATKANAKAIVALFIEATAGLAAQAEMSREREKTEERLAAQSKKTDQERLANHKKLLETQQKYQKSVEQTNKSLKDSSKTVSGISGEIGSGITGVLGGAASAAGTLLKWIGIGGVAGGLLGFGGLFGADKLAHNADDMRRNAQGLGTTPGNQNAFRANFERVLGDPDATLERIQDVISKPQEASTQVEFEILRRARAGQDTSDIAAALTAETPEIAKRYGFGQNAENALNQSGLGQIFNSGTVRSITSPNNDVGSYLKHYENDKRLTSIGDDKLKTWQDTSRDLAVSGSRVDKILIEDLSPLASEISKASTALTDFAGNIGDKLAPKLKDLTDWLDGRGLENAEKEFVDGLHKMSKAMGIDDSSGQPNAPQTANDAKDESSVSRLMHRARNSIFGPSGDARALGATEAPGRPEDWRNLHNPGDLFVPGSTTQMLGFASDADGLRGIDKQLMLYEKRDHLDTIEKIVKEKYAPFDPKHPNANDPEAYIRNLVTRTGIARDQKLDSDDVMQRALIIAGITKQEHSNTSYQPGAVVTILNQTGGSAITTTNQLAR